MAGGGLLLRYAGPSALVAGDSPSLDLRTWTPDADVGAAPHFFRGFVDRADLVSAGILAVAQVAASRYYEPMSAATRAVLTTDPVVTADGQRLRFESFSACCGVHARFDVDPEVIDGEFSAVGTTNIDVNPPLRSALARVLRGSPLRLSVGDDHIVVETLSDTIVERKVDLPARWVKGFAETQVAQSRMTRRLELDAVEARRLLGSLPPKSRERILIEAVGRSWRLVSDPARGHTGVVGVERLHAVRPLLPFIRSLAVYGPAVSGPEQAASTWEFALDVGRLSLTLSPEPSRGFSGEGGLLDSLLGDDMNVAGIIDETMTQRALWAVPDLAAEVGTDVDDVRRALDVLAASGKVGYDLHHGSFFGRVLPLGSRALTQLNPRLGSAAALLDADAVTLDESGLRAVVVSGDHHHVVNLVTTSADGARCTCAWYAKHRGGRGPCKHVLAAVAVVRRAEP